MVRVPEGLSQTAPRYCGGQLRFLRGHVGPSEIFGLGAIIPIMNATVWYKGRSATVRAGLDTGASGTYIIVETAIADKLGLPRLAEVEHTVVGGAKVKGSLSELDRIEIEGLPGCTLRRPPAVVMGVGMQEHDILIGENYLRAVGATISYKGGQAYVSCGGDSFQRTQMVFSAPGTVFLALGGLIFLGFLLSLMVKE